MDGQFCKFALEIDGPEDIEDRRRGAKDESFEEMRGGGIAKEGGEEVGGFRYGSWVVFCA